MQSYRRQVVHPRGKLSSQVDSAHSVMLRRVVVLQAFRWPSVPLQVPRCSFSSADVSSPPSAAPAAASLSLQDLQRQRSPLYKPVRGQTPLLLPLTAAALPVSTNDLLLHSGVHGVVWTAGCPLAGPADEV